MDYTDLAERLLAGDAGTLDDVDRARVEKALAYDREGIVIPENLRARLRKLWNRSSPLPCANLDKRGSCIWLSKREPPGTTVRCPFYDRRSDPRECNGYRESKGPIARRAGLFGGTQ